MRDRSDIERRKLGLLSCSLLSNDSEGGMVNLIVLTVGRARVFEPYYVYGRINLYTHEHKSRNKHNHTKRHTGLEISVLGSAFNGVLTRVLDVTRRLLLPFLHRKIV